MAVHSQRCTQRKYELKLKQPERTLSRLHESKIGRCYSCTTTPRKKMRAFNAANVSLTSHGNALSGFRDHIVQLTDHGTFVKKQHCRLLFATSLAFVNFIACKTAHQDLASMSK